MPTWEDSSSGGDWEETLESHRKQVIKNSEKLARLMFEYQTQNPKDGILLMRGADIKRLAGWLAERGVMPW